MERVGDAVAQELSRFGAGSQLAAVVDAWPRAVGPEIARNAWPARIGRDGTLHVHTSSAAWAFELGHLEERLRTSLGAATPPRFRFTVGPLPEPASSLDTPSQAPVEPSAEHRARAAELVARIDDEDLRKIVAKAAAVSLAKADSDRLFWYHQECPQAPGLQGFFYE
jgi:hypothetical protein